MKSQLKHVAFTVSTWMLGASAFAQAPAPPANSLLGTDCDAPPIWHCPDAACDRGITTQPGNNVELMTRRTYFLDCPKGYKKGDKVNVLLSLHGFGSYANWQRNYAPFYDVKDKYKLVVITPGSPVRFWSEADDQFLHNIVDQVVAEVGKANVERFILAGHSQGGLTSQRLVCTDYFKDKVDVRISLSGGRVGPSTSAGRGFANAGPPVYQQVPGQPLPPPQQAGAAAAAAGAAGPPGGACDYSFIFTNGAYETIPGETSPLADKVRLRSAQAGRRRRRSQGRLCVGRHAPGSGLGRLGPLSALRPRTGLCLSRLQGWPRRRRRGAPAEGPHRRPRAQRDRQAGRASPSPHPAARSGTDRGPRRLRRRPQALPSGRHEPLGRLRATRNDSLDCRLFCSSSVLDVRPRPNQLHSPPPLRSGRPA